MNGSYIIYKDYNPSSAMNFFRQKQNFILQRAKEQEYTDNEQRLNAILKKAQEGLTSLTNEYVTEENLAKAIEKSMNTPMSQDLEDIASSIGAYFSQAEKMSKQVVEKLQKKYERGYGNFEQIVNRVLKSGSVTVDKDFLLTTLSNLSPSEIKNAYSEVGNPLGQIGELAGLAQLYDIGMQLVDSSFKKMKKDIKIEVVNTGRMRTMSTEAEKGSTLTTDNLLIIRKGNKILYQLNLSNKLTTDYKASKQSSTKRAIKLRTTTVNSFLKEHEDWAESIYNIISYHRDTKTDKRLDFLPMESNLARQTLGVQILYDHVFGTRENFQLNDEIFKDEVQLIAYGTKIIASASVLRYALFTKAMKEKKNFTMAQIDRSSWFENKGDIQSKSYIVNELDAQHKIAKFNLIYKQTLNIDNSFPLK